MHKPVAGPRFFFNAFASGFSGKITKPFHHVIDVQASCSLPSSGGYASARVENFRFREMISFKAAYTQITGGAHDEEGCWNQVITSTVEGVNVLNQFTADRVAAVLSIKRPYYGEPPIFRIVGCRFDGLHVGGDAVRVEFNHGIETWEAAVKELSPEAPPREDLIVASAIRGMQASRMVEPNVIDVPDFGRVILGEYMITPHARSLSMFRLELGCGNEGDGGGGYVGGNGTRVPYP